MNIEEIINVLECEMEETEETIEDLEDVVATMEEEIACIESELTFLRGRRCMSCYLLGQIEDDEL